MTTLKSTIHFLARTRGIKFPPDSNSNARSNVLAVCRRQSTARPNGQLQTGSTLVRASALLFTLLWLASVGSIQAATSWDLASEFSANNPSAGGVWRYGWKLFPNTSWGGSLDTYYQTQFGNGVPLVAWYATPDGVPAVYANQSGQIGHLAGNNPNVPSGTVFFFPGYSGRDKGVIRFTAPASGTYQIDAWSISFITTPITLATRIFTL